MLNVTVDNANFSKHIDGMKTMGELVEYIKATIDPDSIITAIDLQGKPISEEIWHMPLTAHQHSTLTVTTGDKYDYLVYRLSTAEAYIDRIADGFKDAGMLYGQRSAISANQLLSQTIEDLLAFLSWYMSVLTIESEVLSQQIDEFNFVVNQMQDVCEVIHQQQLFNNWSSLGKTLEEKLEPVLQEMKKLCRSNYESVKSC